MVIKDMSDVPSVTLRTDAQCSIPPITGKAIKINGIITSYTKKCGKPDQVDVVYAMKENKL
jgi:hypothetical protein